MSDQFSICWIDSGCEPQCEPNPEYPHGRDIPFPRNVKKCRVDLPYPAKRCGVYIVTCARCAIKAAVTTAGRKDDPRSVEIACQELRH